MISGKKRAVLLLLMGATALFLSKVAIAHKAAGDDEELGIDVL